VITELFPLPTFVYFEFFVVEQGLCL
jgi:hypothetical protein